MLPRGRSGIRLLRVQTTNRVDPGRYSQRSTAFPRRDRNVKVGLGNVNVGDPPPSVSASTLTFPPLTATAPKSRPYTSRRDERGAAKALYREKSPATMSGCMNSSSVSVGENVTLNRVSIDTEFCVRCANTYR